MVSPNWGLLGSGQNALSMFQMGNQMGQQARERQDAHEQKNALTAYAQTPNDETLAPVIAADPRLGMQLRHQQQQHQAATQERQSAGMVTVGKMLRAAKADPSRYGQIRQAAAQNGIDISRVPEAYDPAWVDQQLMFVDSVEKDGGERISGIARELVDAGYQPDTPEFAEAMRGVIQNKYASDYVDEQGNTRRRSALSLPGGPQAGPAPGTVEDGYRFKGGNPADPSAWEPLAQGGPTVPQSGGFRP